MIKEKKLIDFKNKTAISIKSKKFRNTLITLASLLHLHHYKLGPPPRTPLTKSPVPLLTSIHLINLKIKLGLIYFESEIVANLIYIYFPSREYIRV